MPFDDLIGYKRQIWRYLLLVLMLMQLSALLYQWRKGNETRNLETQLRQHYIDADRYHLKREAVGTARAKVSVMIVNAIANGRTFTPDEKQEMSDLWKSADFDKIQEKFLDGKNE